MEDTTVKMSAETEKEWLSETETETDEPMDTSDSGQIDEPSADLQESAVEIKDKTDGIQVTGFLEWKENDKAQEHQLKKKDLQKALQSWLNKNKENVTCSVLNITQDGRADIMIEPAAALNKFVSQEIELSFKDHPTAFLRNFSTLVSEPETQTPGSNSVDAPFLFQAAAQHEKEQGLSTAAAATGQETIRCTLSPSHFWYVSQAYKEEMRRIGRKHGVQILADVNVSFVAKQGAGGDPDSALNEFTNIVQTCLGDSSGTTIPLRHADPDGWKDTLKITQADEAKLVLSVSSDEITVYGPSKNQDTVRTFLKAPQTTFMNGDNLFGASAWGSHDTLQKIDKGIQDPLVYAGLTMDESHWNGMTAVFNKKIAQIKAKFDVVFKPLKISQGKVNVKACATSTVGAVSLESHALRALQCLYQKVATSTVSCPLLAPDLPQDAGETLQKFLSKHPGVEAGGQSGAERISGLPEILGPAVDELEKILGRPVLKEEDKQRIQYSRHTMSNGEAAMEGGATAGGTTGGNKEEDICPICMDTFTNKKKIKCSHEFCEECLARSVNSMGPICPLCKTVFGRMEGDQPDGTMLSTEDRRSLPGFPHCGSITITYKIPSGTQTAKHPNPGQPYSGATRTAYLPNNQEGREVLHLLRRAFDRRLIFTVGTSRTTGVDNQVTWNDIHHKTNPHGGSENFGYPDPGYLSRVREELKAKGIE